MRIELLIMAGIIVLLVFVVVCLAVHNYYNTKYTFRIRVDYNTTVESYSIIDVYCTRKEIPSIVDSKIKEFTSGIDYSYKIIEYS